MLNGSPFSGGFAIAILALAVYAAIKLFFTPLKIFTKVMLNAAFGLLLLLAANYLGKHLGFHVSLTWVSALVAGFFGIPGVIAVLLFEQMF